MNIKSINPYNNEIINTYKANTEKILSDVLGELSVGDDSKLSKEYVAWMKSFYGVMGAYTHKAYLHFDVIKSLTGLDHRRADQLSFELLFQLPFLLRAMEHESKHLTSMMIQVFGLEQYVKTLQDLEIRYYPELKAQGKVFNLVNAFEKLSKLLHMLSTTKKARGCGH